MTMPLRYLKAIIDEKKQVQIGLRATGQPLGPGQIEEVDGYVGLFRMLVPAEYAENQHARKRKVLLPIAFTIDDVAIIIEEPRNIEGEPLVQPVGNGRTPGGLIIPGGS